MFGDDVWRDGAQAEAVRLAELLEAPVFTSRTIFANFPTRHPLFCGNYPASKDFEKVTGLQPDLLFLVGCQGVHGTVHEPTIMQIGPNPLLMGRHYPLDVAVQCELRDTLRALSERAGALERLERLGPPAQQGARVRQAPDRARGDAGARAPERRAHRIRACWRRTWPACCPKDAVMVQESSTARATLMSFGHGGMTWTRSGGGSLGFGVGAAIGAKIAVGRDRPVMLNLGDGALGYSAVGFWTMARYNTAVLTVVSANDSYQIVRHNWAKDMPDAKMIRDGKYPGLWLSDPAVDYVSLARSQGVDGECVKTVKELEPALRRGLDITTRGNRPYVVEVAVAREGVGADSTWFQDWKM